MTRYKYQGKYQFIDNSEPQKATPMMKALIERVLSKRRVSAESKIVIEDWIAGVELTIDGVEYMISWDIEFSSEVVTDISWSYFKMVKDEDGEHGHFICDGYYKFWNADYDKRD